MSDMPLFVKIHAYKDVLDLVNSIKSKLEDAKRTLTKVTDLKNEENAELELWQSTIEEIEQKVDGMDKSLFEHDAL